MENQTQLFYLRMKRMKPGKETGVKGALDDSERFRVLDPVKS